ncbi:MAG: Uma2 family endonuclease [Cyanobacteria bacterium J06633_2]
MVISPNERQSTLDLSPEAIGEQRVLLHNVSWHCFEMLLAELDETRGTRLAYDSGMLEIMSPLMPHEHTKRLLERFVEVLCEEMQLEIKSAGALTSKKVSMQKGMEPDSAFYIQNEPLVRHKLTIDFELDPPPDLMIEVDFSSSSLPKEPIYIALQIPEVWRYAEGLLTIKWLVDGAYVEKEESLAFPNVLLTQIPTFLKQSLVIGEAQTVRNFRQWVDKQLT